MVKQRRRTLKKHVGWCPVFGQKGNRLLFEKAKVKQGKLRVSVIGACNTVTVRRPDCLQFMCLSKYCMEMKERVFYMERKYQIFYPGVYSEEEQEALKKAKQDALKAAEMSRAHPTTITQEKLLHHAFKWDPDNPLFNDVEYAKNSRWNGLYAMPGSVDLMVMGESVDRYQKVFGDAVYLANDGGQVEFFRPVRPGDVLTVVPENVPLEDITPEEGSYLRTFKMEGRGIAYDQNGEKVMSCAVYTRNSMSRYLDDGPRQTELEKSLGWINYLAPGHYTTEEEWKYIESLWEKETRRGSQTLYWEDVNVGDEPAWCCDGPVSALDMAKVMDIGCPTTTQMMKKGRKMPMRDPVYNMPFGGGDWHYSNLNIPGGRAIFYNFHARNYILRMITNWMGDDGFIRKFYWTKSIIFKEMNHTGIGAAVLNKVPYMQGKYCNRHGMEGDTCISKGYVTAKYVGEDGNHYVDMSCWGETLDGDIIQVVEATIMLPTRENQ